MSTPQPRAYTLFFGLLTLVSAGAPLLLFYQHRQEQKQAVKKGTDRQTWFTGIGGSRFNQALQWDAVFCYLTFLGFAYRETRIGRARGPFWLYALTSTVWGVSPALPFFFWREQMLAPTQENSAGEHKGQ